MVVVCLQNLLDIYEANHHIASNFVHGQIQITLFSTFLGNNKNDERCFLTRCFYRPCLEVFSCYAIFKLSAWKRGCIISFELEMPQTSSIP